MRGATCAEADRDVPVRWAGLDLRDDRGRSELVQLDLNFELGEDDEELSERLPRQLPAERDELTLADLLGATEGILEYPQPTAEERELGERGRLGSKQLRKLRKTLERNRLTMSLFDTRGWVRDFEKALKIQWEIYANGLAPMHIVVARSDRIYGTEVVTQEGAQRNP